ncbi:MAG: hypothetical protein VYE77_06720 [Planctomycetota bacterium]|nr:hypothetical protein [Planctomycetota bacterium]
MTQQIHAAEKGEVKADAVKRQLQDLWSLAGPRSETAFLLGYAKVLLAVDAIDPPADAGFARWFLFGQLRAHDRRGERNWVAELVEDPQVLVDILSDPALAGRALPLVVRTLFWCGDLNLALRAIEYLSAESKAPELDLVVDAAITDLLARLETRVDSEDEESTASILSKMLEVHAFDRLPAEVRARYHKALAERLLATSDWESAGQHAATAAGLAAEHPQLLTAIQALSALAALRVHAVEQLEPRIERPEREAALEHLEAVEQDPEQAAPSALFVRSLLAYEVGDFDVAARGIKKAISGMRRKGGRDDKLINRARFYQAAALLAGESAEDVSLALRLMEQALETVRPDLESFLSVHEALKKHNRQLALRFLDAVDVGRGTSPDQLLFVALEYLALGESKPAEAAARRVLDVAVDLDQRLEAMRAMLTALNMRGDQGAARSCFAEIRELLMQRGEFEALENLLQNEASVGQALDHVEIKVELAAVYEEMEGRDYERANLQIAIARSLRARKEVEALRQAHGLLAEVSIAHPELAREDLDVLEKLLALQDAEPVSGDAGAAACASLTTRLGHRPRVLVVGGNERQRRHHPRFEELAGKWDFDGEWLMTNYTSPQKVVHAIGDRVAGGIDLLVLLHWNRHETTEPALELARRASVPGRTVHYAGFTSLQVALGEMFEKMGSGHASPTKA